MAVIWVNPASLQAFWLLQTRVCEDFPVPKPKRRGNRSCEPSSECVNDSGLLSVHQPHEPGVVVEQDPHSVRLPHQSNRNHLTACHGEPLPLSIAEHPGGAAGTNTLVSGHPRLRDPQTKLLGLFHRDLPVVSFAANRFVAQHDGPLSETLGVVLDLGGVEAQHAVDDACVFLEEVQAAVGRTLIESELKV